MKNEYEHIIKMENIMVEQEKIVKENEIKLNEINNKLSEFDKLYEYYYSEQRSVDLDDDENHLIPGDINRGVLSEDEIYNLILDYKSLALNMIETGLDILKRI